jgi:hypothetical protein
MSLGDSVATTSKRRPSVRQLLALFVVSVLSIGVLAATIRPLATGKMWDGLFYRSMAYNLFSVTRPDLDRPPPGNGIWTGYARAAADPANHFLDPRNGLGRQPPYAYRPVTPLLARAVSSVTGDIEPAFYAITLVCLVLAGAFIGLTVLELVGSTALACLAVLLFALSPATARIDLSEYMLTDPLSFLLAALAVYALVRRNRPLFFAACLVGVFGKETIVPLVLSYPLSEWLTERRVRATSVVLSGVVLAAWTAWRVLLPVPVNRYSLLSEFVGTPTQGKLVLLGLTVAFGPLLVTVWRAVGSWVGLSLVPFALANVASEWFIGGTERAAAMAAPFVIVSMLWLWPPDRLTRLLVLAPAAAYVIYAVLYPLVSARLQLRLALPFIVLAAVTELLLVGRLRRQRLLPTRTTRPAGVAVEASSA